MRKINHFGVPTTTPQPGEVYAEGLKVWLTMLLRFDYDREKMKQTVCL